MAYTYLPQNTNTPISLETIAREFNQVAASAVDQSVQCETVPQSWLVGAAPPAFLLANRGLCWGGTNGQYMFVVDVLYKAILRFNAPTTRPTGVTSSTHWNSNLDEQATNNVDFQALSIGNTSDFGPNITGVYENSPQGITISPDGHHVIVVGDGNGISEYRLFVAWDLTTAMYYKKFSITGRPIREYAPTDCWFSADGSKLFVAGAYKDSIHTINLPNAYTLDGAVYNNSFYLVDENGGKLIDYVSSVCLNATGTKMYVSGYIDGSAGYVYQYDLAVANDPTSAVYNNRIDITSFSTNPTSVTYAPFGTVTNHPTGGAGVTYDIGENLVIISQSDGMMTLELPPPPAIPVPISFRNYFRNKGIVPDLSYTQKIPEEYDKSTLAGFVDSAIDEYSLLYFDSVYADSDNYLTNGFDFSRNGDYIFTNHGNDSDTVIFRHDVDSAFTISTTRENLSHQVLSISGQKLGGITFSSLLDNGTFLSQNITSVDYPVVDSDALKTNYITLPDNKIRLDSASSVGTYQGLVSGNASSNYKISAYVGGENTSANGNTSGIVAAFNEDQVTLGSGGGAGSSQKALIMSSNTNFVALLQYHLQQAGFVVDVYYDKSPITNNILQNYSQVYDLLYLTTSYTSNEQNNLAAVVQNGNLLYIQAEWPPQFNARNAAVNSVINLITGSYATFDANYTSSYFTVIDQTYLPGVTSIITAAAATFSHTLGRSIADTNTGLHGLWLWDGLVDTLPNSATGKLLLSGDVNTLDTTRNNVSFIQEMINLNYSQTYNNQLTLTINRNLAGGVYPYDSSSVVSINPSLPRTFSISLNTNQKLRNFGNKYTNAISLISGGIHGDVDSTNNQWNHPTLNHIQSYIEINREYHEIGIFISPLTSENDWGTVSHYPSGTEQGDWDWKYLQEDSGITGLTGIGYYLNLNSGAYRYRDWISDSVFSGIINGQSILDTIRFMQIQSAYGISAYNNPEAHWEDFTVNGNKVLGGINISDYQDKFVSHKMGKNGTKVYAAVNTYNVNTGDLYSSKILGYDLVSQYDLSTYSYNEEVIYTYDSLINGSIQSFDFGVDSFNREGGVLYTLNEPSNKAPNVTSTLVQYKLDNAWLVNQNTIQSQIDITTSDLRYTPSTIIMADNGKRLILGGYSDKVYVTVANLATPYQLSSATIIDDSTNTIELTGLYNLTSLYISPSFDRLIVSGTAISDSENKLFAYENIGFLNPISFSQFTDSI